MSWLEKFCIKETNAEPVLENISAENHGKFSKRTSTRMDLLIAEQGNCGLQLSSDDFFEYKSTKASVWLGGWWHFVLVVICVGSSFFHADSKTCLRVKTWVLKLKFRLGLVYICWLNLTVRNALMLMNVLTKTAKYVTPCFTLVIQNNI